MKMSRNLKIKIAAIVVALASVAVMGVLLFNMQNTLTQDNYAAEMVAETGQLDTLLADAASEADQNKETFDAIYQSKAQSIAFMADNDTGYEAADAKMREYRELLGVDNVLIVRRDGSVVRLHRRRGRGRPVRHLRPARRRAPRRGGAGRCEGGRLAHQPPHRQEGRRALRRRLHRHHRDLVLHADAVRPVLAVAGHD